MVLDEVICGRSDGAQSLCEAHAAFNLNSKR